MARMVSQETMAKTIASRNNRKKVSLHNSPWRFSKLSNREDTVGRASVVTAPLAEEGARWSFEGMGRDGPAETPAAGTTAQTMYLYCRNDDFASAMREPEGVPQGYLYQSLTK